MTGFFHRPLSLWAAVSGLAVFSFFAALAATWNPGTPNLRLGFLVALLGTIPVVLRYQRKWQDRLRDGAPLLVFSFACTAGFCWNPGTFVAIKYLVYVVPLLAAVPAGLVYLVIGLITPVMPDTTPPPPPRPYLVDYFAGFVVVVATGAIPFLPGPPLSKHVRTGMAVTIQLSANGSLSRDGKPLSLEQLGRLCREADPKVVTFRGAGVYSNDAQDRVQSVLRNCGEPPPEMFFYPQ